jgi:16S rRNA processing protein RimM
VSTPARPVPSPETAWIAVGRVTRAHGIHGEVAILPLTEVDRRFEPGSTLRLGDPPGRTLTVGRRRTHRGRPLVLFEGVHDRDQAEALRGEYLFVAADEAPALPEGRYWPHQVVGCEVVTESGRRLGSVREIVRTPANDVWVADGPQGEVLVPALRDVVRSVDVAAKRVVVAEVPGLTVPGT